MAPSGIPSLRLYGLPLSRSSHHSPPSSSLLAPPLTTSACADSTSTTEHSFTDATHPMPPPGPAHYEARRTLWLAPPANPLRQASASPSTSRAKLEALLGQEGRVDDDVVWNSGLRGVWKGLVSGGRLRRRLPLPMVIKILMAGWLRDGTWPSDSAASPPSPVLPLPALPVTVPPPEETSRGDGDTK